MELVKAAIDAQAMAHTAMVMRDIGADILGVVEAENRPALDMFSAALLREVDATPYEQVMVIDGNDTRGIDVGVMATGRYPLGTIRSPRLRPRRRRTCVLPGLPGIHVHHPGREHAHGAGQPLQVQGLQQPR